MAITPLSARACYATSATAFSNTLASRRAILRLGRGLHLAMQQLVEHCYSADFHRRVATAPLAEDRMPPLQPRRRKATPDSLSLQLS